RVDDKYSISRYRSGALPVSHGGHTRRGRALGAGTTGCPSAGRVMVATLGRARVATPVAVRLAAVAAPGTASPVAGADRSPHWQQQAAPRPRRARTPVGKYPPVSVLTEGKRKAH